MNQTNINETSRRRALIRGASLALAGVAAASLLVPQEARATNIPSAIPGTGDIQVLNYALALEDLEADLYSQALLRLTTGGNDPQASSTVGKIVGLGISGPDVDYIKKFSSVEAAHRDFLKNALGTAAITAVSPSKYDFGIQNMTREQVLNLVLEAEATGVQAYLGAIPCFTAQSKYLQTAAAIQGTEARHTAVLTVVRNLLVASGVYNQDAIAPVAPQKGDPITTSVAATAYNPAVPSQGTPEGRDAFMLPADVLTRVGPFIKKS